MIDFKNEFLEVALNFSEAKRQVFGKKNLSKSEVSKNIRIANKMVNKAKKMYVVGYKLGVLTDIEDLMSYDDIYIKWLAATYSLVVNEKLAIKVLNELIELPNPNYVSVDARLSLDAWRRGYLDPTKF